MNLQIIDYIKVLHKWYKNLYLILFYIYLYKMMINLKYKFVNLIPDFRSKEKIISFIFIKDQAWNNYTHLYPYNVLKFISHWDEKATYTHVYFFKILL